VKHPLSGGDHELLDDTKRKTLRKVVEENVANLRLQVTLPQNLRENPSISGVQMNEESDEKLRKDQDLEP